MTTIANLTPAQIADELLIAVHRAVEELRTLDAELVRQRPEPARWSIQEVVGHLIDSAANNHQRFVRAQFTTELVFPKYEQNEWIDSQAYNDADWLELLDLWVAYNRHLAHVIRRVPDSALEVRCTIGNYAPATLHFLMTDYVVHLRHHLQKIAERLPS
ncbi:MAG: DinB family protein [Planctomycetaceae bacterium]|nr:DinB family protein [Planctomycetaceae bacterium]